MKLEASKVIIDERAEKRAWLKIDPSSAMKIRMKRATREVPIAIVPDAIFRPQFEESLHISTQTHSLYERSLVLQLRFSR
jgi:hypothetical protein